MMLFKVRVQGPPLGPNPSTYLLCMTAFMLNHKMPYQRSDFYFGENFQGIFLKDF